jgi:hypothetical protein
VASWQKVEGVEEVEGEVFSPLVDFFVPPETGLVAMKEDEEEEGWRLIFTLFFLFFSFSSSFQTLFSYFFLLLSLLLSLFSFSITAFFSYRFFNPQKLPLHFSDPNPTPSFLFIFEQIYVLTLFLTFLTEVEEDSNPRITDSNLQKDLVEKEKLKIFNDLRKNGFKDAIDINKIINECVKNYGDNNGSITVSIQEIREAIDIDKIINDGIKNYVYKNGSSNVSIKEINQSKPESIEENDSRSFLTFKIEVKEDSDPQQDTFEEEKKKILNDLKKNSIMNDGHVTVDINKIINDGIRNYIEKNVRSELHAEETVLLKPYKGADGIEQNTNTTNDTDATNKNYNQKINDFDLIDSNGDPKGEIRSISGLTNSGDQIGFPPDIITTGGLISGLGSNSAESRSKLNSRGSTSSFLEGTLTLTLTLCF